MTTRAKPLPEIDPPAGALDPLRHLAAELRDWQDRALLRLPPEPVDLRAGGKHALLLCSNDYLGYAADPWLVSEASGAGASRLVAGEHTSHLEAEAEIGDWLQHEGTLLFSSGYAANVGALSALARPGDTVFSDALNHASIIDGCRLSGARITVVPHRDVQAMERALAEAPRAAGPGSESARRWVVTESYFSMDGDSPDLRALRSLCYQHDAALYVDEAHAVGVFGPRGRGLCAESGIRPDILVGTFGKALGLQGAFVAGSRHLRQYLWNRARSFVFSTGLSPALAAGIRANVRRAAADERGREALHDNAQRLREGLRSIGVQVAEDARGPVLPWIVGDAAEAMSLSGHLREEGVIVQAIRPPTVPVGTARLRITATARLGKLDIERAITAFGRAAAVTGRT